MLVVSVAGGFLVDRDLGKSLLLIGFSLGLIGTISLAPDLTWANFVRMGSVLIVAVVVPYVVDRFVFKRHVVRFPINTGRRWTTAERWYVVIVVGLAWLIMPFYFINSGTYLNWPSVVNRARSSACSSVSTPSACGTSCSSSAPCSPCCDATSDCGRPTSCRRSSSCRSCGSWATPAGVLS